MESNDNPVDNPLTNTCRIFTTGHCNLEEQLDDAKRLLREAKGHFQTLFAYVDPNELGENEYVHDVQDFVNNDLKNY